MTFVQVYDIPENTNPGRKGKKYDIRSKVYAIDTTRDRFLILKDGRFKWVFTVDCRIDEEDV